MPRAQRVQPREIGGFPIGVDPNRRIAVTMHGEPRPGHAYLKEMGHLKIPFSERTREALMMPGADSFDAVHRLDAGRTYEIALYPFTIDFCARGVGVGKLMDHRVLEREGYMPIPAALLLELRLRAEIGHIGSRLGFHTIVGYHRSLPCTGGVRVLLKIDGRHPEDRILTTDYVKVDPPGIALAVLAPAVPAPRPRLSVVR